MSLVTSCQDCIFAEYLGHSQIGCKVRLLNKYIVNGIAQEAYNTEVREKQEFYILPGIACIGKIPSSFVTKENLNIDEAISFVKEKLKIQWQAIIILYDEDIKPCLDALAKQEIKPENVTVILTHDSPIAAGNVAKWLKQRSFKTWRVMETENQELSRGNLVDLVLDKYTNPFYMVLEPTKILDDNFIVDLNRTINEDYISFGIIKMEGVELTATAVHKFFNGNSFGMTLEEKLIEEKCQDKIINLKS